MLVIGLTGQTGAGKSEVARQLAQLGCTVISCDAISRDVASEKNCINALSDCFGKDILLPDQSIDRKALAKKAFSDPANTEKLNAIMHPRIMKKVEEELQKARGTAFAAVIDAPQLFEAGGETLCDSIFAVTAPRKIRLSRVMNRDGITEEEAKRRMSVQKTELFFRDHADFVIDGTRAPEKIRKTLERILLEMGRKS